MAAIAIGTYYFAKATRIAAELDNPRITTTIARAMEAVCRSEIRELGERGRYPCARDTYDRIIKGKTASLFVAAVTSGAYLIGTAERRSAILGRYAECLGMAFQLVDDVLDFSENSGKPLGQDIRQRSPSLPLTCAVSHKVHGVELRRLLASDVDDMTVARVIALVTASGVLSQIMDEARNLASQALDHLDRLGGRDQHKTLAALARSAVTRQC